MTSTTQIELEHFELPTQPSATKQVTIDAGNRRDGRVLGEVGGAEPNPTPHALALEKWNEPRGNMYRMAAIFISFFVMGSNDSAYGPLIPYVSFPASFALN